MERTLLKKLTKILKKLNLMLKTFKIKKQLILNEVN